MAAALTARAKKVLRAALIVTWVMGVFGAASSCRALQYYRSPTPAVSSDRARDVLQVVDRHKKERLPLAAANLLLSAALVVGAARTLGRKAGGNGWLRQVCVASALFVMVEWVASRGYRADLAEVAARFAPGDALTRFKTELSYALVALLQLGLFVGLSVALGRGSVALELAPTPNRGEE